jgi:multidrug resistance efflux pump
VTLDKEWFPAIPEEEQYFALVEQYGDEEANAQYTKILTSALVKRAMATITRMWDIQKEKPSLNQLVREGVVGENQLQQLTLAEEETEAKLEDIQQEAECYKDGWSKTILQESAQLVAYIRQQQQRSANASAKNSAKSSPAAKRTPKLSPEEELERRKAEADRAARELIEEEEKSKKSKSKKSK